MKITKKELIKTAKELNELMGLKPAIPTAKDTEDSVLMEKIGEAAEMLEEDDEISEVAQAVIDFIAEEKEEAAEEEKVEEEEKHEPEEEETTEQLVEKSDYKVLKTMVAEYPEFKGIDINLYPIKKTEELRAHMLKVLAKAAEKENAPEVKKEEKKPVVKKELVKKETPAKKGAEKEKPISNKTQNESIPLCDVPITIGNIVSFEPAKSHPISEIQEGVVIGLAWEKRSASIFVKIKNDNGTFHKEIHSLTIIS